MPNWVYSGFCVTGDVEELRGFREAMFHYPTEEAASGADGRGRKYPNLDFASIIPPPADVVEADGVCEEWAIENWGVKWNALDTMILSEADEVLRFQFTTPWDFPTPVFEALAAQFPHLVFSGSSYEESGAFEMTGEFNGENSWGHGKIEWDIVTSGDDDL